MKILSFQYHMCLSLKEAILEEQEKKKSKNLYVWQTTHTRVIDKLF